MSAPRVTDDGAAVREGIVIGLIGASVVALFYLGVDLIRGLPLLTPSVLGETYVLRQPESAGAGVNLSAAAVYTFVHVIAFVAFGLLVAALARRGETSSVARYAVFPLFLAFEVFFLGVLAVGSATTRGVLPMGSVLTANALAALAMAWYAWRTHPRLREAALHTPLGAPEAARE